MPYPRVFSRSPVQCQRTGLRFSNDGVIVIAAISFLLFGQIHASAPPLGIWPTGLSDGGRFLNQGLQDVHWQYRITAPPSEATDQWANSYSIGNDKPDMWSNSSFARWISPRDDWWGCKGRTRWEMRTTADLSKFNMNNGITIGVAADDQVGTVSVRTQAGATAVLYSRTAFSDVWDDNDFMVPRFFDINVKTVPGLKASQVVTITVEGYNANDWENACGIMVVVGPRPTPPAPTGVSIKADERVATLSWSAVSFPLGVTNYAVTWGPVSGAAPVTVYTSATVIQLQPLTPGVAYYAFVQQVSTLGQVGLKSRSINFQSDSRRVDNLRKTMTAFFDDFNRDAGGFDELKWNTAFPQQGCPNAIRSGAFINSQFHAHSSIGISNSLCGRTFIVNRARKLFDFNNRVGTLVVDFDFGPMGHEWMIRLVDASTGRIDTFEGWPEPKEIIIRQDQESDVTVMFKSLFGDTKLTLTSTVKFIKNVRRNFVITLDHPGKRILVSIDGQMILRAYDVDFEFTRAHAMFVQDLYNPEPGTNDAVITAHWDNFGFDGPAVDTVTHNYPITKDAAYINLPTGNTTLKLVIPDSIRGAVKAVLLFSGYLWGADWSSYITVNGRMGTLWKDAAIFPPNYGLTIPLAFLKGDGATNLIVFSASSDQRMNNVHLEIDFPGNAAPAYTQPSPWYGQLTAPSFSLLGGRYLAGPTLEIEDININGQSSLSEGDLDSSSGAWVPNEGVLFVKFEVSPYHQMLAFGKSVPLKQVVLQIDRKPVKIWDFPTPYSVVSIELVHQIDLSKLPAGTREIYVIAYDKDGTPSIPDSGKLADIPKPYPPGKYVPRRINVSG